MPRRVISIGPMRPAYVSETSSVWEWYIHITELPSSGPGPARGRTSQVYVCVPPVGTASSSFWAPCVPSL